MLCKFITEVGDILHTRHYDPIDALSLNMLPNDSENPLLHFSHNVNRFMVELSPNEGPISSKHIFLQPYGS